MNMFLHELKAYRKSTIIWTCSLFALVILFMSMFPAISKDASDFTKIFEGYPEPFRRAMGFAVDSFASILGFYAFFLLYVLLCGAMQAMNLGTSIVSKEVRERTADFLLTKPVTRTEIMTSKLLAALASLVITNVVYLATASIMMSIMKTKDFNIKIFLLLSLSLFFIQLIFLALGIIISVIARKIKSVLPISLSTVFGLFFIGALAATSGEGALRYISPFKYFDTAYIIKNSSYEASFIIVAMGFIIAAITASYLIYCKKDIHSV